MNYITILFFFRDKYFINISIIYIKDFFVFIVKVAFLDISVVKIYVFFRSLLYTVKTKSKKKNYNNYGWVYMQSIYILHYAY